MCGIVGLVGNFRDQESLLEKMKQSLVHRGPDQEGSFIDRDRSIFLGHRRLNVIDLSDNARQPMARDGVVIVYNGEIYNYLDLRSLLQEDFSFKSNSDTEVLLNGYLKWGIRELLSRVQGMFAICFYDSCRKKIFLARDRMGEKPLYYFFLKDRLAFSSELKAFRQLKEAKYLDFNSVDLYFTLGYIPAPNSLLRNTHKLMPGHFLTIDLSSLDHKEETYWDIDPTIPKIPVPEHEAKSRIYELIDNSVKKSLYSDVPLGVFLSGGLDSSSITFFSKKNYTGTPKTFSAIYSENSFDESKYSRLASHEFATDHHELKITSDDAKETVRNLHRIMDEPLADMSFIPTYLLSRLTRNHVTVALGGDGADELFLGYPTQLAHSLTAIYSAVPVILRKGLIEKVIYNLPVSDREFSLEFRLKRFVQSAAMPPLLRHFSWQAHIPLSERKELFTCDYDSEKNLLSFFEEHIPPNIDSIFNLIEYLDLKFYLPNNILAKVDISSMSNSLEVRSPFLNHKLVEFVYSLDTNLKFRRFNQKYILKKSMEDYILKKIVYRKKHGFGIPLGRWLRNGLHGFSRKILSEENVRKLDFLNYEYIEKLLGDHESGRKDNRKQIWSLIVLVTWFNNFTNA